MPDKKLVEHSPWWTALAASCPPFGVVTQISRSRLRPPGDAMTLTEFGAMVGLFTGIFTVVDRLLVVREERSVDGTKRLD
jgi:hypothetical protein